MKMSPEEVLNYVEMPIAASEAINELLEEILKLKYTNSVLQSRYTALGKITHKLDIIIMSNLTNSIIPELESLSDLACTYLRETHKD